MMQWEIVHIPEKPPSSLEQSTVDILAANIEPKLANTLVRQLYQICPLEDLHHVKRVRRRSVEGIIELSVILCLSNENGNYKECVPNEVLQTINAYQLSPFNAKVAKYAATSKEEWEEQCKLWPTSYHPPSHLDGINGISVEESQPILNYMKVAMQLTKSQYLGDKVVNAAVIVDPLSEQIISSACDQTCPRPNFTNKSDPNSCVEREETTASSWSDANGLTKNEQVSLPKFSHDECSESYAEVSCLNPWGWMDQRLCNQNSLVKCGSKYSWHPLRHAAMVAIENAAARDRQLFPGVGSSENNCSLSDDLQCFFNNSPAKRQKTQPSKNKCSLVKDASTNDEQCEATRPYLCTGFDIYLVWEPCAMCAMALVHQRIRRIFYAFPNPNAGALGSVYRLHGEKSLNHHYTVFRILVPEKVLHELPCAGGSRKPLKPDYNSKDHWLGTWGLMASSVGRVGAWQTQLTCEGEKGSCCTAYYWSVLM